MNDDDKSDTNSREINSAQERLRNVSRRGLNVVTGGAWNRAHNAPIVGRAAQKVENKVADKLGDTKLGKKIADHHRPNLGVKPDENKSDETDIKNGTNSQGTKKNGDVGSRNLQNSLANKTRNLLGLKNKNKNNSKSEDNSSSDNNTSSEENKETENNDSDENNSLLNKKSKIRLKRILIIKVAIIAMFAFMVYALFMVIVAVFTGGTALITPAASTKGYGTDEFEAVTDEESELYQLEIDYNKRLKEISDEYGDEINIDYLNAILLQLYYEYSVEELKDSEGIDYGKMKDNIDTFLGVLRGANSDDYAINGVIYNTLKESSEFKEYYKDALKDKDIDEILYNIFTLAEEMSLADVTDETVITEETIVTVTEGEDGKQDAPAKRMTINEYISGSIYAEFNSLSNTEMIKAYTIALSTNIIAKNKKLTIDEASASMSGKTCSVKEGCSYDKNGNLVSGPQERSDQNTFYLNGEYYYKKPLSSDEINDLNKIINNVFGNVLVSSDGKYPTLELSKLNDGGDYKTILKNAYGDYTIKNIGEDSYILDGSFGDKKVKTDVIFYDQGDYANYSFCGLKTASIKSSGCGVTSMAIVVSTYENDKKYDPIWMNKAAMNKDLCGKKYDGTAQAFFCKEAASMKYKCSSGKKTNKAFLNSVLKHLSEGHLVVVRMGKGHFTGGGHYMVLGGIDPETKKVYVYDPNNASNSRPNWRNTGNGWYSFNDIIVKEAYNFYIIWKG